jgi:hypothetical protein
MCHRVGDARHVVAAWGGGAKVEQHPRAARRFGVDSDDRHSQSFNAIADACVG